MTLGVISGWCPYWILVLHSKLYTVVYIDLFAKEGYCSLMCPRLATYYNVLRRRKKRTHLTLHAVPEVGSTTTHPRDIFLRLELLQAVLIQPSLPVPSRCRAGCLVHLRACSYLFCTTLYQLLSTAVVVAATTYSCDLSAQQTAG